MIKEYDFILWNEMSTNIRPNGISPNKGYLVQSTMISLYIHNDLYDEVIVNNVDYITIDKYALDNYGFKHLDKVYHLLEERIIEILDIQMNEIDQLNVCYVSRSNVLNRSDIKNFCSIDKLRSDIIDNILE